MHAKVLHLDSWTGDKGKDYKLAAHSLEQFLGKRLGLGLACITYLGLHFFQFSPK